MEKFKQLHKLWWDLREGDEAMEFRKDVNDILSAVYFDDVYIPYLFAGRVVPRIMRVFVYDLRNQVKFGIYPILRINFQLQTFSFLVPCQRTGLKCEGFSEVEVISDYLHTVELRRTFFPSKLAFVVVYPNFEGLNAVGFPYPAVFSFGKNVYFPYDREKLDQFNISPFIVPRLKRFIGALYERADLSE
jgi:hypothetical protein